MARLFSEHREAIRALLPEAEVEHIGATAVPGVLTKGDLDLLVRVPAARFATAIPVLKERYEVHQPENWTSRFASFKAAAQGEIPVAVQLVAADSEEDRQLVGWRERLIADRGLLDRYNAFKRAQVGAGAEAYAEAKAEFINRQAE